MQDLSQKNTVLRFDIAVAFMRTILNDEEAAAQPPLPVQTKPHTADFFPFLAGLGRYLYNLRPIHQKIKIHSIFVLDT